MSDVLPSRDIDYETLWNMYHDLYRDYEVLQEEKRRLWDIIQRNMQSYSERLYALEHAERPDFAQAILAEQTNLHAALETIKQLSTRVNNEESGQVDSGQINAPATKDRVKGGHGVKNVHPKVYSSKVVGEVIRQYAQTYPQKTHVEIATHFQVSTKTVQ